MSRKLSEVIAWSSMRSPSVVEHKGGYLQSTLRFRGKDMLSATEDEMEYVSSRLNDAIMALGGGYVLHMEVQRRPAPFSPPIEVENPACAMVCAIRHANLSDPEHLFVSRYYLTITHVPKLKPTNRLSKWTSWLFEQPRVTEHQRQRVADFERMVVQLMSNIQDLFCELELLKNEALLTYLHSTVSTKNHQISMPSVPVDLDQLLTDTRISARLNMRHGHEHMRVISIKGYAAESVAGLMMELEELGFAYRWVQRMMVLDALEARAMLSMRENALSNQKNKLFSKDQQIQNQKAIEDIDEVGYVLKRIEQGQVALGLHSAMVIIRHFDEQTCHEHAQQVEAIFNRLGFVSNMEDTLAFEVWQSSLPGHFHTNPRRALMCSDNFAHFLPLHATWAGDPIHTELGQAPHLQTITSGSTPFNFNSNDGDVGHMKILGMTGGGKSFLMSGLGVNFLKYIEGRVIYIDHGRSSRCAALAVGGSFVEVDLSGKQVAFQPLARLDEPEELAFAYRWLRMLFDVQNLQLTTQQDHHLRQALHALSHSPVKMRTLSNLQVQLQDHQMKMTLAPYCHGPQAMYAQLWDGDQERLDDSVWLSLEIGKLMEMEPAQIHLTLMYLIHRLNERFDGRPYMFFIDEAWACLNQPMLAREIEKWLRLLRKKRVYVVLATQNLQDAFASDISPTLMSNCPTTIFLPSSKAKIPFFAEIYKGLGLNSAQIEILANAAPQKHYYYHNDNKGSRLFELAPSDLEISIYGASRPQDHRIIDAVEGKTPFLSHYFDALGESSWRRLYEEFCHA